MEHADQIILMHTKNLPSQSTDASLLTTVIRTSRNLLSSSVLIATSGGHGAAGISFAYLICLALTTLYLGFTSKSFWPCESEKNEKQIACLDWRNGRSGSLGSNSAPWVVIVRSPKAGC